MDFKDIDGLSEQEFVELYQDLLQGPDYTASQCMCYCVGGSYYGYSASFSRYTFSACFSFCSSSCRSYAGYSVSYIYLVP